uniref:Uncharacterized protein n=1 Tax=Sphaerodactylus townsendi TaxID=933632 RepID=A0ACB8EF50_9SAUR
MAWGTLGCYDDQGTRKAVGGPAKPPRARPGGGRFGVVPVAHGSLARRSRLRGTVQAEELDLVAPLRGAGSSRPGMQEEEVAVPGHVEAAEAHDGGALQKPPYSYVALIATAIQESPEQRLPVGGIYRAIAARFPYYRLSQKSWQNTVRHTLSVHACFRRVPPRPPAQRARSHDWQLDPAFRHVLQQRGHRRRKPDPGPPAPQQPPAGAPHLDPPYYLPGPYPPLAGSPPAAAYFVATGQGQPGLGPLGAYGAYPGFLVPHPWSRAAAFCLQPPDVPLGPRWTWPQEGVEPGLDL